jgi:RNA recognition motif-containing protein
MEYKVLHVPIEETPFYKFIFFKQHVKRGDEEHRTLFVTNVPWDCSQGELKTWFEECGEIQSVEFKESLGKDDIRNVSAYLVFSTEKGLKKALKMEPNALSIKGFNNNQKYGLESKLLSFFSFSFFLFSSYSPRFNFFLSAYLNGLQSGGKNIRNQERPKQKCNKKLICLCKSLTRKQLKYSIPNYFSHLRNNKRNNRKDFSQMRMDSLR